MPEYVVGTPQWWVGRLYKELSERRPALERPTNYYDGDHNLKFASQKFLEAFGGQFEAFADNWCGVVVDAVEERLQVDGFRVDAESPDADRDAWDIWQRNGLDLQSQMAHLEALITGVAYAVVWQGPETDKAEITVESGSNTIIACHPKFRDRKAAGLRVWRDDERYDHAELFLPKEVFLLRTKNKAPEIFGEIQSVDWEPEVNDYTDGDGRMVNPLNEVPVVEFRNSPRLTRSRKINHGVHSEIRAIMPMQDAVNKLMADMLTSSEFAAYPQRWLTGYEPGTNTDGSQRDPEFKSGAGKVWWLEAFEARFGQFPSADLGNFVTAIDMVIQHIASISRTPPHYLNASADRLSGESIKAAETGLVAKCRRRTTWFGEAWEEVIRLAGNYENVATLKGALNMETIWHDVETRSEAEMADAATKRSALGVPWRQTMEDLGYTQEAIERMAVMRTQDALLAPEPAVTAGRAPSTSPAPAPASASGSTPPVSARTGEPGPMNGQPNPLGIGG